MFIKETLYSFVTIIFKNVKKYRFVKYIVYIGKSNKSFTHNKLYFIAHFDLHKYVRIGNNKHSVKKYTKEYFDKNFKTFNEQEYKKFIRLNKLNKINKCQELKKE